MIEHPITPFALGAVLLAVLIGFGEGYVQRAYREVRRLIALCWVRR